VHRVGLYRLTPIRKGPRGPRNNRLSFIAFVYLALWDSAFWDCSACLYDLADLRPFAISLPEASAL